MANCEAQARAILTALKQSFADKKLLSVQEVRELVAASGLKQLGRLQAKEHMT